MRDYCKLAPQFWIGTTGRKLHGGCPEATVVAVYLLSGPHSTMLGLYYLPKIYLAHETGLGTEGALKGLARAIEMGFCQYDDASETVFIPEMARFQIAEQLEPRDNRVKWIQRAYDALPDNPFLGVFYEKYARAFHLMKPRAGRNETISPSEAPSKPFRSQEKEKEQEIEQEHEKEFEQEIGEGAREKRGRPRERETILEITESNAFEIIPVNENPNISNKGKDQMQHQKLLQGEIKLYQEQHGRKPDDNAFGVICQKNRIPFEYGKMLLER